MAFVLYLASLSQEHRSERRLDFPRAAKELGVHIDPIGSVEDKISAVLRVMAWAKRLAPLCASGYEHTHIFSANTICVSMLSFPSPHI